LHARNMYIYGEYVRYYSLTSQKRFAYQEIF